MDLLIIICLSFAGGLIGALLVKKFGLSVGLVDRPNARSSHQVPTPKGGGVGIILTVTLIVIIKLPLYFIMMTVIFCLAAIALVDDIRGLSVKLRFAIQITAASIIVLLYHPDLFIQKLFLPLFWEVIFIILFLLFLVATTNFFNFMDGINGIAGFEAMISFLFIGLFHLTLSKNHALFILSIAVCGATAGFLVVNFPRAKVFMGDAGSIFLGFLFAVLVVISARNIKDFFFLTLLQATFYIDCVVTIFLRKIRKENVFAAHRFHLYQELVHKKGWSHARVTITYAAVQVLIAAVAWIFLPLNVGVMILFWLLLMVLYVYIRFRFFNGMEKKLPEGGAS